MFRRRLIQLPVALLAALLLFPSLLAVLALTDRALGDGVLAYLFEFGVRREVASSVLAQWRGALPLLLPLGFFGAMFGFLLRERYGWAAALVAGAVSGALGWWLAGGGPAPLAAALILGSVVWLAATLLVEQLLLRVTGGTAHVH